MKMLKIKKSIVMRLVLATVSWVFLFSASAVNASSVNAADEFLSPENKMASGTIQDLLQTMKGLPEGTTAEQLTATLEKLVTDGEYTKSTTPAGVTVYTRKGAKAAYSTTGIIAGRMVIGDPNQVKAAVADLNLATQTTQGVANRDVVDTLVAAMANLNITANVSDVEAAVAGLSADSLAALQAAVDAGFMVADLSDMDTAQFVNNAQDAKDTLALVVAGEVTPIIALMNKTNANEAFDVANMIEEIIKVNILKQAYSAGRADLVNEEAAVAYAVSTKALSEAQVALKASSIAAKIKDIQTRIEGKENVAAALTDLVEQFNTSDNFPASIQEALIAQIGEIALELEGEVSLDRIENLHQIVADLDKSLKGSIDVGAKIDSMSTDSAIAAVTSATSVDAVKEQGIFIDQATYNAMLTSQSRTAQAYAAVFKSANAIIADMASFNANADKISTLVVDPANTVLVNAAKAADKAINYVANESIQSMELMDLALLTGDNAQVRKIFFQQLDPQVQVIYAAVYGESLMDVINGKYKDAAYSDVDLGTVALQIQIRSEVAAAIKA